MTASVAMLARTKLMQFICFNLVFANTIIATYDVVQL